MRITDVRTVLLTGPYSNDPYICALRPRRSAAFVEIFTDTEHVGDGETYAGYFFPEGVPPIVEFLKPILIGQSPDDIHTLWKRMYHSGNYWSRVGLGVAVSLEKASVRLAGCAALAVAGSRLRSSFCNHAMSLPSAFSALFFTARCVDASSSLAFR